jgi:hypothetical protein
VRDRHRNGLTADLPDRTKVRRARIKAGSAFYAFLLLNHMDSVLAACNRRYRAFPKANHASPAFIRINMVGGYFAK